MSFPEQFLQVYFRFQELWELAGFGQHVLRMAMLREPEVTYPFKANNRNLKDLIIRIALLSVVSFLVDHSPGNSAILRIFSIPWHNLLWFETII